MQVDPIEREWEFRHGPGTVGKPPSWPVRTYTGGTGGVTEIVVGNEGGAGQSFPPGYVAGGYGQSRGVYPSERLRMTDDFKYGAGRQSWPAGTSTGGTGGVNYPTQAPAAATTPAPQAPTAEKTPAAAMSSV